MEIIGTGKTMKRVIVGVLAVGALLSLGAGIATDASVAFVGIALTVSAALVAALPWAIRDHVREVRVQREEALAKLVAQAEAAADEDRRKLAEAIAEAMSRQTA